MSRILRKIALAALGLLAATAFVEMAVRITVASPLWRVLPVPEVALYGPDPFTGYRHRPDVSGVWTQENRSYVVTSSLGLRDRERPLVRSEAPRIVVIGNSLLEALQVGLEQTAVFVAERLLQDRHKGAEVVNLGLAGASPPVEVARLQSVGVALKPDIAVVMLPVNELFSPGMTNDGEFTGYRRDGNGQYSLHYGFRDTSGYHFRTSRAGRILYWLLDHSEVMRIYNARKNVGLLAEWPHPVTQTDASNRGGARCAEPEIERQLSLWRDRRPEQQDLLAQAVIRDLAAVQREHGVKVVVAATGIGLGCPDQAAARKAVFDAMRVRLAAQGLTLVDVDRRIADRVGPEHVARLHGFGPTLGSGHLNITGNRAYGEMLAEVIAEALRAPAAGRL